MAKSYSMDLRSRLVAAVADGMSRRGAARRFGVSASSAVRFAGQVRATGSVAPRRRGRPAGRGKLAPYKAVLIGWVEATPDVTMPELASRLNRTHGVSAHPSALSRLLCREGWTYKKSPRGGRGRARRRGQTAPALVSLDPALAAAPARPGGFPR